VLIISFPFLLNVVPFLSLQMAERVSKEAKRSHKDKVDAFNEHLSSLSEHHDIPKVSFFVEAYDNSFLLFRSKYFADLFLISIFTLTLELVVSSAFFSFSGWTRLRSVLSHRTKVLVMLLSTSSPHSSSSLYSLVYKHQTPFSFLKINKETI
jgi:hypothetical protein